MNQIKPILISIVVSLIIGSLIGFAVSQLTVSDMVSSTDTLDYLIDNWIQPDSNQISLAGIPARKELPDARPHYFPSIIIRLAEELDSIYQIPKGTVLAQWALESKWGMNNLGASNYFGHTFAAVRQYMTKPAFVWAREKRVENGMTVLGDSVRFASYVNVEECFLSHGRYLSREKRYRKAFEKSSAKKFALEIARAGYATDPDYGLKLIIIIERYHLE